MCLIAFAWRRHPRYRLILAANRDELYERPAQPMHWWPDRREVLAGRDLQAGGTWLALDRDGRFATVTNFREEFRAHPGKRSRGELVTGFVSGDEPPLHYAQRLEGERYAGFSLLLAAGDEFAYVTNRGDDARLLGPGVYGLSNATLDTPWSKVLRSRAGLTGLIERDAVTPAALLRLLSDERPAPAKELGDDLPFALARAVSAPFICTERYGTRCTTVVLQEYDGRTEVQERRYNSRGKTAGEDRFRIIPTPAGC